MHLVTVGARTLAALSDDEAGVFRRACVDALRQGGDFVAVPGTGDVEEVAVLVTPATVVVIETVHPPEQPDDADDPEDTFTDFDAWAPPHPSHG